MIDTDELSNLIHGLHYDPVLSTDEFVRDLIRKIRLASATSEAEAAIELARPSNDAKFTFTFGQFLISTLNIDSTERLKYNKSELRRAFQTIGGSSSFKSGVVSFDKLSRAIKLGAGGAPAALTDPIINMLEHYPGGNIKYDELIGLMNGVTSQTDG